MKHITRSLAACSMALGLLFGLSGPLARAQQDGGQIHITQVDTSQFPKITVYVSATDANGEPLGVDPKQIAFSENGQAITPQTVSGQGEIGPLTTLLVVDISGSMNEGGKLAAAKAAAKAYINQMRDGDQAGLVTFNTEVTTVQPVTQDRAALTKAIDGLKAKNDTAMFDALAQGEQTLQSVNGRKAIIVLTDGLDNRSKVKLDQVTKDLGPSGLSISTIGLGDPKQLGITNAGIDEKALQSLADQAGGTFGYANTTDSLTDLYQKFGRALQSEYAITYTSPSALRDGVTRNLSVSLNGTAQAAPATSYNPGGLVPEVAQSSWPLFGLILVGLLILLALPMLIRWAATGLGKVLPNKQKKSNVRMAESAPSRIRLR